MIQLALAVVLSLGLLLGLSGTPTTYVPIPEGINAQGLVARAREHLESRGFDLTGYSSYQYMVEDEKTVRYLQARMSMAKLVPAIQSGELPVIHWYVRFIKAGETRRHGIRVALDGTIVGYVDKLPEVQEGSRIDLEQALDLTRGRLDTQDWELVGYERTDQDRRRDWAVTYRRYLGGDKDGIQIRTTITVNGDQLGGLSRTIKLSEHYLERRSAEDEVAETLYYISVFADAMIFLAAMSVLLGGLGGRSPGRDSVGWAWSLVPACLVFATLAVTAINYLPVSTARTWTPEKPYWAYGSSIVLYLWVLALVPALAAFLALAAGSRLHEGSDTDPARSLRDFLSGRWSLPAVRLALARGLLVSLVIGGAECLFYEAGRLTGWITLPVTAAWVNTMSTSLPWMYPLSISIGASLTEESVFRYFCVSVLYKRGFTNAALILPALAWAFAHSLESVYPVGTRGIELFLGGLILGTVFLKTDLLTVVTAHYLYDAVTFGWPLYTSDDPWSRFGSLAVCALFVLPGLWNLPFLIRSTFRPSGPCSQE